MAHFKRNSFTKGKILFFHRDYKLNLLFLLKLTLVKEKRVTTMVDVTKETVFVMLDSQGKSVRVGTTCTDNTLLALIAK